MPAPSTIVNFKDIDGDIFPIRIFQKYEPSFHNEFIASALRRYRIYQEAGHMTAREPLTFYSIEELNS